MPTEDYEATVRDEGRPGYPYRLSCSCGFSQDRSDRGLAIQERQAHLDCPECSRMEWVENEGWQQVTGGHCAQPCRTCLGHCQNPCPECDEHDCRYYCENCGGHCEYPCDDCQGHCQHWCQSYCGGHCRYDCPDCEEDHRDDYDAEDGIHDYRYKPIPVFHGQGPLYVGLELETSWQGSPNQWLADYVLPNEDTWYAKEDSSVSRGIELVTHPMTTEWALSSFPTEWISAGLAAGAIPDDESCGTHIHLSRRGLNGRQWWVLFAIHRQLADLCGHVGGRGTQSTWANWDYGRDVLAQPVKAKIAPGSMYSQRYVPVNVLPTDTVELRYPAGDFTPTGFRRNVQWVQALTTFGTATPCNLLKVTDDSLVGHIWANRVQWPDLWARVREF